MYQTPYIMPRLFYGDIELEMIAFRNMNTVMQANLEALRFVNGTLDVQKLRFYGNPNMEFYINWFFGPYEEEWTTF